MLEHSKNHCIEKAYLRILESQNSPQKEYAYHCTNVNPKIILEKGFCSSPGNGFTENNAFETLYQKYLPQNPCFVSKIPWNEDSKYILKIDITGLEKHPDFGHLVDTVAYYEETDDPNDMLFYWEEKDLQYPSQYMPSELLSFLVSKPDEERGILNSEDFDGDLSFELIGTCAVDGDKITPDRIEVVKGQSDNIGESSDSGNEPASKKNWAMISNVNKRREAERQRQLVPSEFSNSMKFDKNYGAIVLSGTARNKILQEANSTRNGIENISTELHLSDDGKRLLFDLIIYPLKEWDSTPLKSVCDYFVDYAPWISTYNTKRIVDQRVSFLRYELKDETVLNKARQILGLDDERTDFVQIELF